MFYLHKSKFINYFKIIINQKRNFILSFDRYVTNNRKFKNYGLKCLSRCQTIQLNKKFHQFNVLNSEVVSFKLADIGEGIKEVVIKEWYVEVGHTVNQFDKICEVQSDKASVTITSRFDGKITKIFYQVEDTAKVGEPLVELEIDSDNSVDKVDDQDLSIENTKLISDKPKNLNYGKILTTPAVRKLASDFNINLSDILPTGKDGRLLKEDILNYIENQQKQNELTSSNSSKQQNKLPINESSQEKIKYYKPSSDRIVSIKGIQKVMYEKMTYSLSIPHFSLSDEIDLTRLVKLREKLKSLRDVTVYLTYLPFFIKAASLALQKYPILNACIDEKGENLIYKSYHNIGIAIDTPHGLIVANIKNVNERSIIEIASELSRLQELGNKNQLSNEDLSGATFTLSNIGSIGGLFGIPVIVRPQISIGAFGKLRKVPKFDENDNIIKSYICTVVWTADHRVIDGATICRFNNQWKQYIENPSIMLMHLK